MSWFYDHFIIPFFYVIFIFVVATTLTAVLARTPKNNKK